MNITEYSVPSCADLTRRFEQLSDFGKNVLCQIAATLLVEEELHTDLRKNSSNIIMLKCNAEEMI